MAAAGIGTGTQTTVSTPLGDYEGLVADGVAAFKGIPYAKPPFGERRFQAPEPVGPHERPRPCFDYGPTAPKGAYPAPIAELLAEPDQPGEDCLNLNVWTADPPPGVSQPVIVWIHGGAFVHGSGQVPTYDGSRFARDGVVLVTLNYRLGVDGFLLLEGHPANRGLLDQVAALGWVRDNIAAFGGDPQRVTVAGESAGAMSISTLLAMPAAEGLFQQAVTQSGAAQHVLTAATAEKVTRGLAQQLEIEPTAAAFAAVSRDALIAAQDRFSAALATDRDPGTWAELVLNSMPFEPCIDGEVLPDHPLERIRAGAARDVRLLTGTNREEMTLFLAPTGLLKLTDEGILAMTAGMYGLPPEGVAAYRAARPEASVGDLIVDVVTDWFFRLPALRLAEARPGVPSYVYEFGWRTPQWDGQLGATHALEVPFVFDNLDDPGTEPLVGPEPPQALADEMHAAWVAFAGTGDPGWPAYADDRAVRGFGGEFAGEVVNDPRPYGRQAWSGLR